MPDPFGLLVVTARSGGRHSGLGMVRFPSQSLDSPSLEESESLQVSADLLSVDEHEEENGGEGCGNSDGYA